MFEKEFDENYQKISQDKLSICFFINDYIKHCTTISEEETIDDYHELFDRLIKGNFYHSLIIYWKISGNDNGLRSTCSLPVTLFCNLCYYENSCEFIKPFLVKNKNFIFGEISSLFFTTNNPNETLKYEALEFLQNLIEFGPEMIEIFTEHEILFVEFIQDIFKKANTIIGSKCLSLLESFIRKASPDQIVEILEDNVDGLLEIIFSSVNFYTNDEDISCFFQIVEYVLIFGEETKKNEDC